MSISYHEEEVMPIRKITSLPQGTFIGKVAVENDSPILQPFFCGAIQIDLQEYARTEREAREIPDLSAFELGDLWKQLSVPEIGRAYLLDHLRDKVRREWRRSLRLAYKEEALQQEADRRLSAMTDAECEETLRAMIPELEKKQIARVIEDDYYAIKADIRQLIELECTEQEPEAYVEETLAENQ